MGFLLRVMAGLTGLAMTLVASAILVARWQQPSANWIAYVSSRARANTYDLNRINPDGSEYKQLAAVRGSIASLAWSPDGTRLAMVVHGNWDALYVVDVEGRDQHAVAVQVTDLHDAVWSPDGEWLAYIARGTSAPGALPAVYRVRPDGSDRQPVTPGAFAVEPGPLTYGTLSWSPDGQTLAFGVISSADPAQRGVYRVGVGGGQPVRLADGCCPSWSPNGEWLVYTVGEGQARDLYRMRPGGSAAEQVAANLAITSPVSWSPDGAWLAFFGAEEDNTWTLYRAPVGGGDPQALITGSLQTPATWSPDGEWLAFAMLNTANLAYQPEVYRVRADGHALQRLTDGRGVSYLPVWSPSVTLRFRVWLLLLAGLALVALGMVTRGVLILHRGGTVRWRPLRDP